MSEKTSLLITLNILWWYFPMWYIGSFLTQKFWYISLDLMKYSSCWDMTFKFMNSKLALSVDSVNIWIRLPINQYWYLEVVIVQMNRPRRVIFLLLEWFVVKRERKWYYYAEYRSLSGFFTSFHLKEDLNCGNLNGRIWPDHKIRVRLSIIKSHTTIFKK